MKSTFYCIGIILIFYICGCSDFKNRREFADTSHEERIKHIKNILKDNKINIDEYKDSNYCLQYIEYMLTKKDMKDLPDTVDGNYDDYLSNAIPVLYYAYSPETYKTANEEYQEKVRWFIKRKDYLFQENRNVYDNFVDFLIGNIPELWNYHLGIFTYHHPEKLDEASKGRFDNEETILAATVDAWRLVGTMNDFEKLTTYHQAQLLYYWLLGSQKDFNLTLKYSPAGFNKWCEYWNLNGQKILSSLDIPDGARLLMVAKRIISATIKSGMNS